MTTLPNPYTTGFVTFQAWVVIGSDTVGSITWRDVNGTITFHPDQQVYKTDGSEEPVGIVGVEAVTARVVDGILVSDVGDWWYTLPVGVWRVTFAIPGVPLRSRVIEVTTAHTHDDPLNLALVAAVDQPWDTEVDEADPEPTPGGGSSGPVEWGSVQNKPSVFPPSTHSHPASQLSGVVKSINGLSPDASGEVASFIMLQPGQDESDLPPGTPDGTLVFRHSQTSYTPTTVLNTTGNEPRPDTDSPVMWLWGETRPLNIGVNDVWITSETPAPPIPQRPESLVADYPFTENTGSVAASTTASPDITGIPAWTTRGAGSAMLSQPTGGGSMTAPGTSFGSGGTVMFWIRPDAMPAESSPSVLRSLDSGVIGLMYRFSGQHVLYISPGDYLALEGAPIAEGVWSHFAITQSPPDVNNGYAVTNNFYVNGALADTKVGQAFIPSTAGVWEIGGNATDGGAMGIDDLRLWSVELTPLEINAEMDR